jgi:flavorubredoxin
MAAVLEEIGRKKALNRKAFRFGSYGWSGGAQKELDEILEKYRMNWHFLGVREFNGRPESDDIEAVVSGCKALAKAVKDSTN